MNWRVHYAAHCFYHTCLHTRVTMLSCQFTSTSLVPGVHARIHKPKPWLQCCTPAPLSNTMPLPVS